MIEQEDEIPNLPIQNLDQISSKIDRGEIPKELNFFTGGINREFESKVRSLGISTNSADFLNFVQSDTCEDLMKNNNLKIHVDTGHIFHNNIDANESIFDFFENQEDETKQFLEDFEFNITDSYDDYFMKYLVNIKDGNDDKFDMLTNKNSKFFFYYTNNYLRQINEQVKLIRHSVITNNETALEILQNKYWQVEVCQSNNNGESLEISSAKEVKIIQDSVENLTIHKKLYGNYYNQIGIGLSETLRNLPPEELIEIKKDLRQNFFF